MSIIVYLSYDELAEWSIGVIIDAMFGQKYYRIISLFCRRDGMRVKY